MSTEINKYIVLYSDFDEINFYNLIKEKYNLSIIKFLLNSENKIKEDNIIQIYPDNYIEELLVKDCLFVMYFSKINRSKILINLLKQMNKYIIFNKESLITDIQLFIDSTFLNKTIKESINNFQNMFDLLISNNSNTSKNIKLEYTKINKNYEDIDEKIFMITYYKNTNDITNIIQKKSIIENSKNKYINKFVIIGKNLKELDIENNNLIFHEFEKDATFKDILEIANKYFENKTICIIRSDIILINQDSLEDVDLENNEIICLSRIERLINGAFVKSEKLNKNFYSTSQDAWILKLPVNIEINQLDKYYFYDKYSELYFNQIFKSNGYKLTNTDKYRILRLLTDNNIDSRLLINDKKIEDNFYLLPDNSINKISINDLINKYGISNNDMYELKCEIINKYFKNKIIEI